MRIILSVVFYLLVNNTNAQSFSCPVNDSLALSAYYHDALLMTLKRTEKLQSSYKDSVSIYQQLTDTFINAFSAILNNHTMPEVDTVTRLLNIHIYPEYFSLQSFSVNADSNQTWMKQLRKNIIPTGFLPLDTLMSKYQVSMESYDDVNNIFLRHDVIFKTATKCNTVALSKKFKKLQGVSYSEPLVYLSFADQKDIIVDTITPQFVQLTFSYGWGDCILGCIEKRYWKFRVNFDCSVTFISAYGSPLFPMTAINETQKEKSTVVLHPNPATTHFILNTPHNLIGNTLTIHNTMGQQVATHIIPPNHTIPLEQLPKGIYYIQTSCQNTPLKTKLIVK